jgi:hypothetical protein
MTPDEISARLATLTAAVNGVDQDVQDLQTLRKNDAQIVRTVASDVAEVKDQLTEHGRVLGEHGRVLAELRNGMGALTTMLQTLIERPDTTT